MERYPLWRMVKRHFGAPSAPNAERRSWRRPCFSKKTSLICRLAAALRQNPRARISRRHPQKRWRVADNSSFQSNRNVIYVRQSLFFHLSRFHVPFHSKNPVSHFRRIDSSRSIFHLRCLGLETNATRQIHDANNGVYNANHGGARMRRQRREPPRM